MGGWCHLEAIIPCCTVLTDLQVQRKHMLRKVLGVTSTTNGSGSPSSTTQVSPQRGQSDFDRYEGQGHALPSDTPPRSSSTKKSIDHTSILVPLKSTPHICNQLLVLLSTWAVCLPQGCSHIPPSRPRAAPPLPPYLAHQQRAPPSLVKVRETRAAMLCHTHTHTISPHLT